MNKPRKRGFTLIELLVAISIIAVLSAIGIVSFGPTARKSRDARKRSDLKSIQTAYEEYFNTAGAYPTGCTTAGSSLSYAGTEYMAQFPTDPKTTPYAGQCGGTYYCYCSAMEVTGSGNAAGCSCAAGACSFTAGTTQFCVKHLQ